MRVAWVLVLLLFAPVLGVAASAPQEPLLPWWRSTLLDLDADGLDDALWEPPGSSDARPLRVLVSYARMPTPPERAALEAAGGRIAAAYEHFPLLAVDVLPRNLLRLREAPGVVFVEKNDVLVPMLKDTSPLVGAPEARERYDVTGAGVTIAILDDGAYERHPDLEARVAAGYDATLPQGLPGSGGESAEVAPAGGAGHGTHVAGIAVGGGERSSGLYVGVAPGARFANVKVFTSPNQTRSDVVLRGLDWTLTNGDRLGIRVISLSLGGRVSDGRDAISRAADIAVDKGFVVVAAAGNQGPGSQTVTAPGAAQKAITVGAVDKQKRLAAYSSRGPTLDGRVKPDLVAPGSSVTSAVPPFTAEGVQGLVARREAFYGLLSGTSMAAPHAAGVAALMLEANPDLAPIDVKRIMLVTAQDMADPGVDNRTGFGFLNGIASVQVARDPGLLELPQFRERLASVPDPPPEGILDRLAYEAQSLARSGRLPLAGVLVGLLALGLAGGLWLKGRRRP